MEITFQLMFTDSHQKRNPRNRIGRSMTDVVVIQGIASQMELIYKAKESETGVPLNFPCYQISM